MKNKASEQWEALLRKELKLTDINEASMVLDNGLEFNPYFDPAKVSNQTDIPKSMPALAIGHRFTNMSEKLVNQYLKTLVQYDLQVFSVEYEREVDWNTLLEGIFPEMLFIDIKGNQQCVQSFMQFASSLENRNAMQFAISSTHPSENTTISLDYTNNGKEEQVQVLRQLKQDLSQIEASKVKICVNITPHALNCLVFLNAIHQVASRSERNYLIECNMLSDKFNTSLESGLIQAGSVAVWAAVAKVGQLYFNPIVGEEQMEYARLVLNIQNLLALESKVNNSKYALQGAYIIEHLTQSLLDKA